MQDGSDVKVALVVIGVAVTVMGLVSGFAGGNPFLGSSSCGFLAAEARREAVKLIIGGLVLALGGVVMLARQRNEAMMLGETEAPADGTRAARA